MALWALVHTVVHEEKSRDDFYKCLDTKKWKQIHLHRLSTSWKRVIRVDDSEFDKAFRIAKNDFTSCAEEAKTSIDFVVQIGPYEPKDD